MLEQHQDIMGLIYHKPFSLYFLQIAFLNYLLGLKPANAVKLCAVHV